MISPVATIALGATAPFIAALVCVGAAKVPPCSSQIHYYTGAVLACLFIWALQVCIIMIDDIARGT